MGTYEPFEIVTRKALVNAIGDHASLSEGTNDKVTEIMKKYDTLDTFPDVTPMLASLFSSSSSTATSPSYKHIHPLIFTNGSNEMVSTAISASPSLSAQFSRIRTGRDKRQGWVAVHDMEKFKPHPMVYEYLAAVTGKALQVPVSVTGADNAGVGDDGPLGGVNEVILVSANPFDIVGAGNVGLTTVWLDRKNGGWKDQLGRPRYVINGLGELEGVVGGILGRKMKIWKEKGEKEDVDKEEEE